MPYTYEYPRPAVTVDCLVFNKDKSAPEILLIKRLNEPFKDQWAFPGGFIEMEEELKESASRELQEETGIKTNNLYQLTTVGTIGRDPRGRTISIIYYTFIDKDQSTPKASSDAKEVKWHSINDLPSLAFDHSDILSYAIKNIFN